jgi:hypothetical protein
MKHDELLALAAADRAADAARAKAAERRKVTAYLDHRDVRLAGADAQLVYEVLQEHHDATEPELTWQDFPHVRKCALVVQKVVLQGEGEASVLLIDRQDWNDVIRVLDEAGVAVSVKHLD